MKQKNNQAAIITKLKKWVETAKQLNTPNLVFALPVTRLTSIKNLCKDEVAAQQFALFISKRVLQQIGGASCPEHLSSTEWETHHTLIADAIAQMDSYLEAPTADGKQSLRELLRQIDELQGDDYRNVHWTTVRFVRSGNLLKLEYAIRCFVEQNFPYYVYKLAAEYVEGYQARYGSGLIPESAPKLLEVAEFWCQYYFGQSLSEKFLNFCSYCNPN